MSGSGFNSDMTSSTKPALFAYGTLQHPDIMSHVLGRIPDSAPANLKNYARYRMQGFNFPGIVPEDSQRVDGTLFFDITPEEWERLDAYEADFYDRIQVTVEPPEAAPAFVYVVPTRNQHLISTESWTLKTYKPGKDSGIL